MFFISDDVMMFVLTNTRTILNQKNKQTNKQINKKVNNNNKKPTKRRTKTKIKVLMFSALVDNQQEQVQTMKYLLKKQYFFAMHYLFPL